MKDHRQLKKYINLLEDAEFRMSLKLDVLYASHLKGGQLPAFLAQGERTLLVSDASILPEPEKKRLINRFFISNN